jgi:DNA-binding protein H-NS
MATLPELLERQAAIQAQIESARSSARESALQEIRMLMTNHGLTSAELASPRATAKPGPKAGAKVAAKYRHPASGASWSGRGLKPKWLTEELSKGRRLADFAV